MNSKLKRSTSQQLIKSTNYQSSNQSSNQLSNQYEDTVNKIVSSRNIISNSASSKTKTKHLKSKSRIDRCKSIVDSSKQEI